MMCTDTGLHADQTGWHIGKPCLHLAPRPLLPQHDCATLIEADDVERVLADIDADLGDRTAKLLSHGRAPFIECLLPAYLLTEQEHGRTIPLAVVKPCSAFFSVLDSKNRRHSPGTPLSGLVPREPCHCGSRSCSLVASSRGNK